jgi:hypothetical protein
MVDEKALFIDFWTKESKTTSKVLCRRPSKRSSTPTIV